MTDTFDPTAIDGLLSEPVILPDHQLVLGLMHMDGAGVRVCAWDGTHVRHMSQAAARRLAKSLDGEGLEPVLDALKRLADRADEVEATVATNRAAIAAGLGVMPVEGNA